MTFADMLIRALNAPVPSVLLRPLATSGMAPALLRLADSIPAGPIEFHSGSVLAHLCRCADAAAGDALTVWMAFSHDFGKLTTPREILPHHYQHETRGETVIRDMAPLTGLAPEWIEAACFCSLQHMRAGLYATMRPAKRCDLLLDVHARGLDREFWTVVSADRKEDLRARTASDLAAVLAVPEDTPRAREMRIEAIRMLDAARLPRQPHASGPAGCSL